MSSRGQEGPSRLPDGCSCEATGAGKGGVEAAVAGTRRAPGRQLCSPSCLDAAAVVARVLVETAARGSRLPL